MINYDSFNLVLHLRAHARLSKGGGIDLVAFSDLMMKRLLTLPSVAQVKTNIALSKVKKTHDLPLDHVAQPRQQKRRVKYTG